MKPLVYRGVDMVQSTRNRSTKREPQAGLSSPAMAIQRLSAAPPPVPAFDDDEVGGDEKMVISGSTPPSTSSSSSDDDGSPRKRNPSEDGYEGPLDPAEIYNMEFTGSRKKKIKFNRNTRTVLVPISMDHAGQDGGDHAQTGKRLEFILDQLLSRGLIPTLVIADYLKRHIHDEKTSLEMGQKFLEANQDTIRRLRRRGGDVIRWKDLLENHADRLRIHRQRIEQKSGIDTDLYAAMLATIKVAQRKGKSNDDAASLEWLKEECSVIMLLHEMQNDDGSKKHHALSYLGLSEVFKELFFSNVKGAIFDGKSAREHFGSFFVEYKLKVTRALPSSVLGTAPSSAVSSQDSSPATSPGSSFSSSSPPSPVIQGVATIQNDPMGFGVLPSILSQLNPIQTAYSIGFLQGRMSEEQRLQGQSFRFGFASEAVGSMTSSSPSIVPGQQTARSISPHRQSS